MSGTPAIVRSGGGISKVIFIISIVIVGGAAAGLGYYAGWTLKPTTSTSTQLSGTLSETGSSLLFPLFNLWVGNYTVQNPGVRINTASTGSGTGKSSAEKGTVQIGASDAYLSTTESASYPNMLNIPLAISAQQVNYNVPGLPQSIHLNMSGPVLAQIYLGTILYWNDSQIKVINPGATAYLTYNPIDPIHRYDGSGDTFIFCQYLAITYSQWNSTVGGCGTSISWPHTPVSDTGTGNAGMITSLSRDQWGIAYIGVSYLQQTVSAGLGYAHLKNQAGNFVDITQANIQSASNALVASTPANETLSMIFAPGANSYPIVNYEYAIVSRSQPDANTALLIRAFLTWAIGATQGNSPYFLNQVGFVALPSSVVLLSQAQINLIQGP